MISTNKSIFCIVCTLVSGSVELVEDCVGRESGCGDVGSDGRERSST